LSFRLFGVGVWQGRLPSVLYLFGSLGLIFYLADRLYNRKVAVGTLVVLFFLSGPNSFHPLTSGRTAMAEMPMIFFLLAGYTLFYLALRKSSWLLIPAALLWGVAIKTKAQPLPFWLLSLLIPLAVCIVKRWWQEAILISSGILLAWLTSRGIDFVYTSMILGPFTSEPLPGLFQSVAMVFKPHVRLVVLGYTLTIGLLTLSGFLYAARNAYRIFLRMKVPDYVEIERLVLLGFVGSWIAWYAFLSLGFERYLFPAIFIGSIFATSFIHDLTGGFQLKSTIQNATKVFFRRRDRTTFGALLVVALIVLNGSLTLRYLYSMYANPGTPISEVTGYIESVSDPDDLIETYESELFFLLDRPYHYPPDNINVQWLANIFLGENVAVNYDPLEVNPDFLVIGKMAEYTQIYDPLLSTGRFQEIKTFPGYIIYANLNN
jgi:4-amino-4-deoxy-L-arabinose transferase-like glycosyltransferase